MFILIHLFLSPVSVSQGQNSLLSGRLLKQLCMGSSPLNLMFGLLESCLQSWSLKAEFHIQVNLETGALGDPYMYCKINVKFCYEILDGADLQVLTQSDIMTLFTWCSRLFFVASAVNELATHHSNTWPVFAVAHFRNPPPSPAPQE